MLRNVIALCLAVNTVYSGVRMIDAMRSSFDANVMRRAMSYADDMLSDNRPDGSPYRVLCKPSSAAFSFILPTKAAEPNGEIRARARAAALSDAIRSRCNRSSAVTRSLACRCVVEAWKTSLRATVTGCVKSGLFSRKTVAVITFVMLAIDRSACEFSSHNT